MKLKLRAVGTSTGILLPKEMLVRMKLKKDDNLFAVETPEGYLLTPYDPEVERQLSRGRELAIHSMMGTNGRDFRPLVCFLPSIGTRYRSDKSRLLKFSSAWRRIVCQNRNSRIGSGST
jgi:hypothetical protein